jgi:adenylylsulfate kinase
LTPHSDYGDDRDTFYQQLAGLGAMLTKQQIPVIFDATANLRRYREEGRRQIPKFLEVFVNCPLEVCMARDPKGIYARAREGQASAVPGLQAVYQAPIRPDLEIECSAPADESAARILAALREQKFIGRADD